MHVGCAIGSPVQAGSRERHTRGSPTWAGVDWRQRFVAARQLGCMSTPPSRPVPPECPVQIGDLIADKYVVDSFVAAGKRSVVLSARHERLGNQVAVKVLVSREFLDRPGLVDGFIRDARAAAGLQSEHVVQVFDVGKGPEGAPYMVMEFLRGVDLLSRLKEKGPLSSERACLYVAQACDAVGHAHELGLVHGDLRPSNLFLAQRGEGASIAKVLNFGVPNSDLTAAHRSPEQIRDADCTDPRGDVWSLGVTLYQLVVGTLPFSGDSPARLVAAFADDPPKPLRDEGIPEGLTAIIAKCLERRPQDRFQSVAELAIQLLPFAGLQGSQLASARNSLPIASAPDVDHLDFPSPDSHAMPRGRFAAGGGKFSSVRPQVVSYRRLLENKTALRAAPVGVGIDSDAPLQESVVRRLGGPRVTAVVAVLALIFVGLLVLTLRGQLGSESDSGAPTPAASPS